MNWRDEHPALLLIDIQRGLDEEDYYGGNRNNRDAEQQAAKLLARWRALDLPIFHIQHSSTNPASKLHPSHPGFAIKEEVKPLPSEPIIVKNVNSAFIGTDLKNRLETQGIQWLVFVGLTTNHCVSTTVRMAANLNFKCVVVSDATAAFDRQGPDGKRYDSELVHGVTLASLSEEFAEVMDSGEVLGRL